MASANVRRKMSYRKPVPEYVPTPPGSPAPTSLPPVDLDLLQVTDDLPSLPPAVAWGISQKQSYSGDAGQLLFTSMSTGGLTSRTTTNMTDEKSVPPHASLFVQGSSSQESLSREPSRGGDHEVDESGADRKRRKFHREYRPPTPPLPAQHKRRRLTVSAYPDEASQREASINREAQETNHALDDREDGRSRSLRPTPSFTTDKTFVSLGAMPQPMGDTSMASGWSGGLTTFVSESDPRLTQYPLPLYNPPSMRIPDSKSEYQEKKHQAPSSRSSWLRDTLASCRAGLQKFCVVLCC